jgi:hypothetical protein
MLTIKGIEKLYKHDVGEWRIARVETINTVYLIQLRKPNGESMQVNLERNKIGNEFGNEYELWYWNGDPINDPYNCVPQRLMLPITQFTDIWKTIQGINLLIH